MRLFVLNASRSFGHRVAACLGVEPSPHEEREFEDGEHKARPLAGVRGRDAYVVHGLHGDPEQSPNDKICRLLFFLATLRDHGAARVTAVLPYLAYARKDRRTQPRDPVTIRYLAALLEAVGVDRVIAVEVHNVTAFQNAFRCEAIHLDTRRLFAAAALGAASGAGDGSASPVVVASPDPGGVKRAQLFREGLELRLGRPVGSAYMEKRRQGGVVSGTLLAGDVEGATVLVVDDLIASGGTMVRAARAARAGGAERVYAIAAHGLFTGDAAAAMSDPALTRTFVSDTVPPLRLPRTLLGERIETIGAAPLVAEAIRCCHEGGSVTELLESRAGLG